MFRSKCSSSDVKYAVMGEGGGGMLCSFALTCSYSLSPMYTLVCSFVMCGCSCGVWVCVSL
jgi:hypothetical protein